MLQSRRSLLKTAALAAAAIPLSGAVAGAAEAGKELLGPLGTRVPGKDPWKGLKVGVASYSFRKLSLDRTIAGIKRVDLHYVSIKDFHLPMRSTTAQRKQVAGEFRDAGIMPISCGVITIKDEPSARQAFEYARDIAVPTIVCHPEPATLPLIERLVKEFNIKIAIHNHGPEAPHFKSPYDAWEAVQKYDPRLGLCIDVGHTARAGVNPVEAIRKCAARLYDCHFKDIVALGARNAGVAEVEVGRGILDIRGMLQALLDIKYPGHVGFEHEKTAENPLPGLAESVGYTKGVLSCISVASA
ncbi:MAG TPA: sugar phosphate isomerase/epimerase [Tepidisphaeraceae bacterium]|nr:sugar phosphate isomerase/epimerase [Tepidisphaeraceae bacterium]